MDAFGAIADSNRRQILQMLANGPLSAGEIAEKFSTSPAAVSQHLRTLRETNLIDVRVDAQRRIYTINPKGFQHVERWLVRYGFFWSAKLDALDAAMRKAGQARSRALKKEARKPRKKSGSSGLENRAR